MSDDRISSGEIYRICLEIRADVKAQNGRVQKLEQEAIRIKAYWSAGAVFFAMFGGWLRSKLGL